MRDQFIKTLTELAEKDESILLITGDLGFGVFNDYQKALPKQFINAGVAEQNMTGLATGMALEGYTVFTYSIGNFSTLRCLEQIRNDAAYHQANVKVVSIGGGFSYGALGFSHHATEDLSIMRSIPELLPTSPSCLWEVDGVTKEICSQKGAAYLRLDKSHPGWTQKENESFKFGKIRQLRDGDDFSIVTTGGILTEALKASDQLKEEGVRVRVLSVHCLRPLDWSALESASVETGGILSLEENTVYGGLGGAIAEGLLERSIVPNSFYKMGLRDGFSTIVGGQQYLREHYQMDHTAVVKKIKEMIARKPGDKSVLYFDRKLKSSDEKTV